MGVCSICNMEVMDDQMAEHAKMHEGATPTPSEESPAEAMPSEEGEAPSDESAA